MEYVCTTTVTSKEYSLALGDGCCLDVPRVLSSHSVSAVWADQNEGSCTCPLCDSRDGECVLQKCHCYNSSSFAPTLSVGHINNAQLCWSNISYDRNNSVIHFFTETVFDMDICKSTDTIELVGKIFVSSARFLVVGKYG